MQGDHVPRAVGCGGPWAAASDCSWRRQCRRQGGCGLWPNRRQGPSQLDLGRRQPSRRQGGHGRWRLSRRQGLSQLHIGRRRLSRSQGDQGRRQTRRQGDCVPRAVGGGGPWAAAADCGWWRQARNQLHLGRRWPSQRHVDCGQWRSSWRQGDRVRRTGGSRPWAAAAARRWRRQCQRQGDCGPRPNRRQGLSQPHLGRRQPSRRQRDQGRRQARRQGDRFPRAGSGGGGPWAPAADRRWRRQCRRQGGCGPRPNRRQGHGFKNFTIHAKRKGF